MKHVKIFYIGFITLFFLAIHLLLFTSSQAFYPSSTFALDAEIYNKKLQSSPENTTLVGAANKNNDLNKLIFSVPFYISNDTLILDKILLVENSNASTNREEVQFFVERGLINVSLVTYNVRYYVEDPSFIGSGSESPSLRNSLDAGSGKNYAKGSGIFLTENGDIIKWDAFYQIIKKSNDTFLYAGIIFFSSADTKSNALSFLINQVGLYEFSIKSKNTTTNITDTTNYNTTTTTTNPNTHRTI